jgi:hypothetical protein
MAKVAEPFAETARKLHAKAFEKASSAVVEQDVFKEVARIYALENPEEFKKLVADQQLAAVGFGITNKLLDLFDFQGDHEGRPLKKLLTHARNSRAPSSVQEAEIAQISRNEAENVAHFRDEWNKAIGAKRWALVAYLLEEAKKRNSIRKPVMHLLEGVALASVGAQAEGLGFLETARGEFKEDEKAHLSWQLVKLYSDALNARKVKAAVEDLDAKEFPSGLFDAHDRTVLSAWTGEKF